MVWARRPFSGLCTIFLPIAFPWTVDVFYLGLGTEYTVDDLQHSILAKILGPQHDISDTLTAAKVISSSLKDKRFLFLLDDLLEPADLVAIGLPMPLGYRQKVIFSTPDEAVCDEIGCVGNTINMHPLGDEDAWTLFMTQVHNEFVENHYAFRLTCSIIGN